MKNKADKYDLRLQFINFAKQNGIKPAARLFATTPKTVRKWLKRYQQEKLAGLNELPRIPLTCPHKTSSVIERKIIQLRKQFPFKGAKRLKREHNLLCSHEAIGKILLRYCLGRAQCHRRSGNQDEASVMPTRSKPNSKALCFMSRRQLIIVNYTKSSHRFGDFWDS
ncbi:MAG: helix-turn-helix domain-containing protein [Planctomycetes bacterium]|nr:helix-turn-helix domain-containing protein [Planctomycetota bacterium]